ncbi:MAG: response regulator [Candidatus Omnitrophota bacterium]|jgi:CheY-like chemotaxis protein
MPNPKILLVDDDPDFKQLVAFDLEKNGYVVVQAGDGQEGLEKVAQEKPDLVLLDIKMPRMDGYTFVRHLKQNPATANLPLIVLTSYEPMRDMFKMEGVDDYCIKSVDSDNLLAAIKKRLKG